MTKYQGDWLVLATVGVLWLLIVIAVEMSDLADVQRERLELEKQWREQNTIVAEELVKAMGDRNARLQAELLTAEMFLARYGDSNLVVIHERGEHDDTLAIAGGE